MSQALTARVRAVEARLAELEEGYGATLYQLKRHAVRTDLRLARVLEHLGAPDVTDEEVEAALDEL